MDQQGLHTCPFLIPKYIPVFQKQHGRVHEYEIAGGGGTDFEVCWNYSRRRYPSKVCYVPDGYPGTVGETNLL